MKFAAIQHDIVWRDRDANFEHLRVLIAEAELNGFEFELLVDCWGAAGAMGLIVTAVASADGCRIKISMFRAPTTGARRAAAGCRRQRML